MVRIRRSENGYIISSDVKSIELCKTPFSIDENPGFEQVTLLWNYAISKGFSEPDSHLLFILTNKQFLIQAHKNPSGTAMSMSISRDYCGYNYLLNTNSDHGDYSYLFAYPVERIMTSEDWEHKPEVYTVNNKIDNPFSILQKYRGKLYQGDIPELKDMEGLRFGGNYEECYILEFCNNNTNYNRRLGRSQAWQIPKRGQQMSINKRTYIVTGIKHQGFEIETPVFRQRLRIYLNHFFPRPNTLKGNHNNDRTARPLSII